MSATRPSWVPQNAGPEFTTSVVPGVSHDRATNRALSRAGATIPSDPAALAAMILDGNRAALARGITLVESNAASHRPAARELLQTLTPYSGQAHRVGISGVPGAGKSTFIEALGNFLCDRKHRVAVLAVDPSSSLTRGSILGDKTRMELLSRRPECFIRPSPSGGALGGVTRKTRETMLLCEAAGYDLILVETVGVGQSEIAVRSMVDTFLLLLIAGAGDELQGMKKGIFEIADLIVVNKADGNNKPRAEATRAEFERVLHFLTPATEGWSPPVLTASALHKTGIDKVWEAVESYFQCVECDGKLELRRGEQALEWWRALVEQELRTRFLSMPKVDAKAKQIEHEILCGQMAPSLAAEEILSLLNISN